jgi:hypothetical protein
VVVLFSVTVLFPPEGSGIVVVCATVKVTRSFSVEVVFVRLV